MKKRFNIALILLLLLPLLAHANCDSVKASIDEKIKANGVSSYSLDVVASDQADSSSGKVVGSCEGDKKIIYTKGDASETQGSKRSEDADKPASASSSGG